VFEQDLSILMYGFCSIQEDFFILKILRTLPFDIKGMFPFYQVLINFSNYKVNIRC